MRVITLLLVTIRCKSPKDKECLRMEEELLAYRFIRTGLHYSVSVQQSGRLGPKVRNCTAGGLHDPTESWNDCRGQHRAKCSCHVFPLGMSFHSGHGVCHTLCSSMCLQTGHFLLNGKRLCESVRHSESNENGRMWRTWSSSLKSLDSNSVSVT